MGAHGWQTRPPHPTPFNETLAQFSPDGKWIAFVSNERRQSEVYVQAFPMLRSEPARHTRAPALAGRPAPYLELGVPTP